ncbi:MAG: glycosyltransferase [Candidatus Sumerlaeota bacterium]
MKILYVCGDHGIPAFGRKGASTHMREMIAAFRKLGHTILLAAADTGGDRRPDEDFEVVRLPCPKSRTLGIDGRYLLANMRARAALKQIADRFQPDAIYERTSLYFTAGEWLEKQTGLPRILEINALLAEEQRSRLHFPSMAGLRRFPTA